MWETMLWFSQSSSCEVNTAAASLCLSYCKQLANSVKCWFVKETFYNSVCVCIKEEQQLDAK